MQHWCQTGTQIPFLESLQDERGKDKWLNQSQSGGNVGAASGDPPLTTLSATEHTCTDYYNIFSVFSTRASPVYSNEHEGVRLYNKDN